MYDTIIIGAGPGGLSAAIYSARKKMKTLIISGDIGGMAAQSGHIENYLGFEYISGPELVSKFQTHLMKYKDTVELKTGINVKKIKKTKNIFIAETDTGNFKGKTIIIATGKIPKKLNIPGEKEFKNKGVTYCATCDAPVFANKNTAVIGGGNSAMDAALSLEPIAKIIYILTINKQLIGDQIMLEKIKKSKKIKILTEVFAKEIKGEQFVSNLIYEDKKGKKFDLAVEGIFVEIGSIPSTSFIKGLVKLNKFDEIIVKRNTETNVKGIFGAGDATTVPEKQIIVAAGEGCRAALSAFSFLNQNKDINDY